MVLKLSMSMYVLWYIYKKDCFFFNKTAIKAAFPFNRETKKIFHK